MVVYRSARLLAFLLLLLISGALWAHTDLTHSVPAQGEVLTESPEQVQLKFGQAVRLMRLRLMDGEGEPVAINFKPSAAMAKQYQHSLPPLDNGRYTVEWGAMAEDGHNMSGSFEFTLNK